MTEVSQRAMASGIARVSLLLTTRNRSALLGCTLQRLAELKIGNFEWEVIVADSGSSDDTGAVLDAARSFLPLEAVHVQEPGKSRALNRALPLATGDLFVFTDDDVIPAHDWLTELVAATRRWPKRDVFGGRTVLAPPPGAPDWIFELPDPALNFARYAPLDREGLADFGPYGPNFAVRASAMEGMTFDETIGPDGTETYSMGTETELLRRILRGDEPAVYVPSALVRHVVRPEQLRVSALCARSDRMGRCLGLQFPEIGVPYLFGAPRWLWRGSVREALNCLVTVRRDGPAYLEPRLRYHRLRGSIRGHREARRRAAH